MVVTGSDEAGPRGLARSSRILDEEHEEHEEHEDKLGDAEAKLNTNHGKDHAVDAHKHDTNRCSHRRPPIRFDPSQRSRQERSFDPNRRRGDDLGRFFLVAVTQSQGVLYNSRDHSARGWIPLEGRGDKKNIA